MKNLYLILFAYIATCIKAQVGIGTTSPHSSAILDISSANKGILLPRLALVSNTDNQTITNPALSLMVYNTANANTGTSFIEGNRIYNWDGAKWGTFTNLKEIRNLKKPIDFARVSTVKQDFTAQDRTDVNNGNLLAIQWLANDVVVANNTDITAPDGTDITIKTTSFYQLSGSFSITINTTSSSATNFVLTLQKQVGGAGNWINVAASSRPIEVGAISQVMTVVFPNIVHRFSANDKIRFVISRPVATNVPTGNYNTGSAIDTRLVTDIKKAIRIMRLAE